MTKLPSYTYYFKGKNPGPTVVITGSVHGNERIGAHIIEILLLIMQKEDINGEIYIIVGNPPAYVAEKRYIDCDLNRQFGFNFDLLKKKQESDLNYEEERALSIAPILKKADFLLDIHSTLKPSVPFIYTKSTKDHLDLASIFDVGYMVSKASDFKTEDLTSSIDTFVDAHGGIGITYETGWYRENGKEIIILKKIQQFLQKIGSCFLNIPISNQSNPKHLIIYDHIVPKSDQFKFTSDYNNFDFLDNKTIIAQDNGQKITIDQNTFIIFPKKDIHKGKIACYLATNQSENG